MFCKFWMQTPLQFIDNKNRIRTICEKHVNHIKQSLRSVRFFFMFSDIRQAIKAQEKGVDGKIVVVMD